LNERKRKCKTLTLRQRKGKTFFKLQLGKDEEPNATTSNAVGDMAVLKMRCERDVWLEGAKRLLKTVLISEERNCGVLSGKKHVDTMGSKHEHERGD